MVPLVSKTWSCSSLVGANASVQQHLEHLRAQSLSEDEMRQQLQEPFLN